MMRRPRAVPIALLALGLLSASCEGPVYDRHAILRDAADEVIVPGYEALAGASIDLRDSVDDLCAGPNAVTLASAQDQWLRTMIALEQTSAYAIGPARDMNLGPEMSFWPISPDAIERNVAAADPIDASYVDALGAGSKGIWALAYLLWGGTPDAGWTRPDDGAIAASLGASTRRCAYLGALADHVVRTSERLASAWRPSEGNYAETLATAGDAGNADFPDADSALVALFTQLLDTLKSAKNVQLGIPIGHRSTMSSPGSVQSPFASASVRAMQADVAGVRALWSTGPHSFHHFLAARDPALDETVTGELGAASAGLDALYQIAEASPSSTFVDYAAGTDHAVGETAYSRIDAAETTIATDVAARLGLSVAFSDMDGD